MRNTHFGDGGFGFQAKFKADLSLDSDRKISRRRGTKNGGSKNNELRESMN
jgi:hypothetical protein